MKIAKVNNFTHNMAFGITYKIVSLLLPFAIRTIMIKQLGTEYLGISSLFSSILQALSLAELGIGSAMVFNMYKPVAENDYPKLCAYMYFYKRCYRVIGTIVLTIGLILLPFLKNIIHGSYPTDINLYVIYLVYLLNTVLSYWLFAYKNSIALAYQRTDIESKILLITQTALSIVQIILLLAFKNYYVYVILIPIATLLKNVLVSVLIDKAFPEITASGELEVADKKNIFKNVGSLFGHQVAFTVINSADNIVLSALLGLNELTIYNNYYYIFNAVMSLLVIYFHSIQAGIGNDIIVNKEGVLSNFKKFRLSTLIAVEITGACLFTLTQPFMKIWMGEKLMLPDSSIIIFSIGFFITQIRKIVTTYKNAAGIWKEDLLKPYIVIVVDIIIDILLIGKIGAVGAMVSTIISMGLIALPWETVVLYKKLFNKRSIEHFFYLFIHSLLYSTSLLLLWFILKPIKFGGFGELVLKLIITIIIEIGFIIIINYRTSEFKWFVERCRKIIRRKL